MTTTVVVRYQARSRKQRFGWLLAEGVDPATFSAALEPVLTPAVVGTEVARRCQDPDYHVEHRVYQLNGHGLHALA